MSIFLQEILIDGRFLIGQIIGHGSFGQIYVCTNIQTDELFAIKVEDIQENNQLLPQEMNILKSLQYLSEFASLYWFGSEQGKFIFKGFNFMVFEMLGPNLEDLFNICNRKFSLKTVLILSKQIFQRIEKFHQNGYVHRDIKPENFLMGLGKKSNQLFLIDFGLSKCHLDFTYRENVPLVGTARFMTINNHLGIEHGMRDDLESIGYIMIYWLNGKLPWQGLNAENKQEKHLKIMESKIMTMPEILAKGLPIEFQLYLHYTKTLRFEDKPDYNFIQKMFENLYKNENFEDDMNFDWIILNKKNENINNFKISLNENVQSQAEDQFEDSEDLNNESSDLQSEQKELSQL